MARIPKDVKHIEHHWEQGGDDIRDVAAGWLLEHADESPNAQQTYASANRVEVWDPDDEVAHIFHAPGGERHE